MISFIADSATTEERYISKETANQYGLYPSALGREMGFRRGDKIITINGKDYKKLEDVYNPEVLIDPSSYFGVSRNGRDTTIYVGEMIGRMKEPFVSLLVPFEVIKVEPGSPAELAGIQIGDHITKVNEVPIIKYLDMTEQFDSDSDGEVTLEIDRKGNKQVVSVTLTPERKAGIYPNELIEYAIEKNSFPTSIQKGLSKTFSTISSNGSAFWRLFTKKFNPRKDLQGPIGIMASRRFFTVALAISAVLYACWNLLPLPKSAFWEIIPLLYEGATKKRYSQKIFERSTILAWIIYIGVMFWIYMVDVVRIIQRI